MGDCSDPRLDEIDLPSRYLEIIRSLFTELPKRTRDKVSTNEFIKAMKTDPQIKAFLQLTARDPAGLSSIPRETLEDVLLRIEDMAPSLVSWQDFLGYVSRGGVPQQKMQGSMEDGERAMRSSFVKLQAKKVEFKESEIQTDEIEQPRSASPAVRRKRTISNGARRSSPNITRGKYNITVPEPFSFTNRDLVKEKGIRQRWLENYIAEIEEQEQREINYRPEPTPIPPEVLIPLYQTIKDEQQARRDMVKQQSIEITKSREKPFSFYQRDVLAQSNPKPEPTYNWPQFQANTMPLTCTSNRFHQMMNEDAVKRQERISRAAQESLRKAKLPPRMQKYETIKRQQEQEATVYEPQQEQFKARKPPDFAKLQEKFQNTLDAKKKAKKTTKPISPKFQQTAHRKTQREFLNTQMEANQKWGTTTRSKNFSRSFSKPEIEPTITKNVELLVKHKQQEMANQRAKQDKLHQEQKQREERYSKMKERVQNSQAITSKTKQLEEENIRKLEESKQRAREDAQDYKRRIKEMNARVSQRPLLVEQSTQNYNKQTATMKALIKLKNNLVENKVDVHRYFTEDEKFMIEEGEYLMKKGKLHV